MCSKDDFLDWNDIDLDDILGEYTDDDFYFVDDNTYSMDSEYGVICDPYISPRFYKTVSDDLRFETRIPSVETGTRGKVTIASDVII